jgi:tetratricopeptide (TPR) repeat protein
MLLGHLAALTFQIAIVPLWSSAMKDHSLSFANAENQVTLTSGSCILPLEAVISANTRTHLARMFRDPSVLDSGERADLVLQLREAVSLEPQIAPLRVLLGMALCVNLEVQEALEELRYAVQLDPGNFIARLKLGELLMRLRICSEAAEHTHVASQLAGSSIEAEMARRQASAIKTMQREGVERGGYRKLISAFGGKRRWPARADLTQSKVGSALR